MAAQPQARYVHSLSSLADLFQFALSTHYEIVGVESVALSEDRAALVGGEAGSTWNLIKGVRRMHAGEIKVDSTDGKRTPMQLPDERDGTLFVFRVFEKASYALILDSTQPALPGDRFSAP